MDTEKIRRGGVALLGAVALALVGLLTRGAVDFSGMMMLLAFGVAMVGLFLLGSGLLSKSDAP